MGSHNYISWPNDSWVSRIYSWKRHEKCGSGWFPKTERPSVKDSVFSINLCYRNQTYQPLSWDWLFGGRKLKFKHSSHWVSLIIIQLVLSNLIREAGMIVLIRFQVHHLHSWMALWWLSSILPVSQGRASINHTTLCPPSWIFPFSTTARWLFDPLPLSCLITGIVWLPPASLSPSTPPWGMSKVGGWVRGRD